MPESHLLSPFTLAFLRMIKGIIDDAFGTNDDDIEDNTIPKPLVGLPTISSPIWATPLQVVPTQAILASESLVRAASGAFSLP